MTKDKKPRNFLIIGKVPPGDETAARSLPVDDEELDLGGVEVDHHAFGAEGDFDSDAALYGQTVAIRDGEEAQDDEEEDDLSVQEFLIDCAIEWLPELPLTESLLENGITLDYGVLVSAKILVEELGDDADVGRLDAMMASLLLFGEDDEDNRRDYYDMLTGEAQDMAHMLDDALTTSDPDLLAAAPQTARLLLFAGIASDVEVAGEAYEDDGEAPERDDLYRAGAMMQTLSRMEDLPPRLVLRAQDTFNALCTAAALPLHLLRAGGRLTLTDAKTPPRTRKPPRQP